MATVLRSARPALTPKSLKSKQPNVVDIPEGCAFLIMAFTADGRREFHSIEGEPDEGLRNQFIEYWASGRGIDDDGTVWHYEVFEIADITLSGRMLHSSRKFPRVHKVTA